MAWEAKDIASNIIAACALGVAIFSTVVSCQASNKANQLTSEQYKQLKAQLAAMPYGTIKGLRDGQVISHSVKPFILTAQIDNNPGNGDWWIIVHKPLDPQRNNDRDSYYPTPATSASSKVLQFEGVHVGEPSDNQKKVYSVGLYFCDSSSSMSLRNIITNLHLRNQGMNTLESGCSLVQDISVTRLGTTN
jgi:hypothetical protein